MLMDRWMDGWMDGMDGWMDGRMDGFKMMSKFPAYPQGCTFCYYTFVQILNCM
jgi:hypothetical protein